MAENILVTGGAGYIGSHVVHELIELGYNVIILDNLCTGNLVNINANAKFVRGDINDDDILDSVFSNGINTVFHFAAHKAAGESMSNPSKYAINNIGGSIKLLNKMVKYGVNYIIFSSSAAVYGNPVILPIKEDHPLYPINYYGYTKLSIEQNLKWFSELKGIKYAALRYFNATGYDVQGRIKGKEKNPANLCPIIMEVISGERKEMEVYGNDYQTPDGTCIRDYIHVNDLSSAHIKALDYIIHKNENLIVNLGTGKGFSVLELISAAEKVSGKKVNYKISGRRTGDPEILIACSDLANEVLNWKAIYSEPEQIFKSMISVYLSKLIKFEERNLR
jgi:UDP-glucose 4-epimerase